MRIGLFRRSSLMHGVRKDRADIADIDASGVREIGV
jgi:hypothetical protein